MSRGAETTGSTAAKRDRTAPAPAGGTPSDLAARERYKRPFDLALVGFLLLSLGPLWLLLWAAIALAIRLEDGGRVFYRQPRLGRGGEVFSILKFRTMVEGAEDGTGPVLASERDRRMTRTGSVLRRFHLDELPQAVNVLRGEMSLVGPRPERPELAERIEREVPGFAGRLRVRPGVAGLAQLAGAYDSEPRRKLRYDNLYIARMNPCLDLKLCLLCVARIPRRRDRVRGKDPGRAGRL
ncbi:MAG: sugar transferase [Deltaproteobacteria bacterium]|nr:sugar transferase [Deltaproteobacteria bacterium]